MLTTGQKFKEILLIFILNIGLPTADIYSDLSLIVEFFTKGHLNYATFLLVPFLLNYILTWINWSRIDEQKLMTWVACLLGCYPQVKAAQVIWYLWTNPEKGMEKKKKMDRDVAEMEVFVEAVPTTMVMTFLMVRAVFSRNREERFFINGAPGSRHEFMFFFSFVTSVLSASFGLAKSLKVGPCRVLAEGGALGGLASPRFLLLSLACGATLVGKGAALGWQGETMVAHTLDWSMGFFSPWPPSSSPGPFSPWLPPSTAAPSPPSCVTPPYCSYPPLLASPSQATSSGAARRKRKWS